ncbi:MAG: ATP-dependent zinc metalloprotease FtsH [Eubacteriales bacterium SKADARSKE-1]|nr:ATP-dependent zinc metalloprotease FtsH [Eubacteriales bacterium SKADARSKE-1]
MNYKKTVKSVMASACILSLSAGPLAYSNQAHASFLTGWLSSHSQEQIDTVKREDLSLLDECSEKAKKINSVEQAKKFLDEVLKLNGKVEKNSSDYSELESISKKVKELLKQINLELDLQSIVDRQKLEEQKLAKDNLEKAQQLEQERLEREVKEKINSAKSALNERIDSLLRDLKEKQKIESTSEIDRIYIESDKIRDKIDGMTTLDRTESLKMLINELQDDINKVSAAEAKAKREAFENLLKETKNNFTAAIENLSVEFNAVDLGDGPYDEIQNSIKELKTMVSTFSDMNSSNKIEENINSIGLKIKKSIDDQKKSEEEKLERAERRANIENNRNFDKQLELLSEGKISIKDVIGGNQKAIDKVNSLFKAFEKYREGGKIKPSSKGVLFYGQPGTGKTTLAKAFAAEKGVECIMLTPSMVMEADGAQKMLQIIELAKKSAKITGKLVVLLIDEIDAIGQKRSSSGSDKVLVSLMNSLDLLSPEDGVIVLATTNRREAIDAALVRSGRLDQSVEVSYPNQEGILEILKIRLRYLQLDPSIKLEGFSSRMKKFNGADIGKVVDLALGNAMERNKVTELSDAVILNSDLEYGIATVTDEKSDSLI